MAANDRGDMALAEPYAADAPAGWFTEVHAAIGHIQRALTGDSAPRVPWAACHPVPIAGQLAGSAATLQQKDTLGPKTGYWWDVRRLSAFGFTAGTLTVYRNSVNANPLHVFTAAAVQTWSASLLLGPEDQLIFVSAGVTGTVQIEGQAIEIESAWLPVYLM